MADVNATLRSALAELEAERDRVEKQIAALRTALGVSGGTRRGRPPGRKTTGRRGRPPGAKTARKGRRRTFTAAQKAEVSRRMKAYWAKRKARK
jgi:hypothetical protein